MKKLIIVLLLSATTCFSQILGISRNTSLSQSVDKITKLCYCKIESTTDTTVVFSGGWLFGYKIVVGNLYHDITHNVAMSFSIKYDSETFTAVWHTTQCILGLPTTSDSERYIWDSDSCRTILKTDYKTIQVMVIWI